MRFLILLLIAFLLYRLLRRLYIANRAVRQEKEDGPINEMVQDPCCKIYLPLRDAHKRIIDEREYFFCSKECGDKFEREIKNVGL